MIFKLADSEIEANGFVIKQLNTLTTVFLEIFNITPKIEEKIEIKHGNKTVFKGYINGVNKIKEGYYQAIVLSNIEFHKSTTKIKCYGDENLTNIIKDVLDVCSIKMESNISDFSISWLPKSTPATSFSNLLSVYNTRLSKKVYWYDDSDKIYLFDKIDKKNRVSNRIYRREGNTIVVENENIPNIFDTIEGRTIIGYKLTSKELELYVI